MEGKEKRYHDAECQLGSREELLQSPPFRRDAGLQERASEVAGLVPEVHLLVEEGALDVVVHVHVAPGEGVQLGERGRRVLRAGRRARECPIGGGETWGHMD